MLGGKEGRGKASKKPSLDCCCLREGRTGTWPACAREGVVFSSKRTETASFFLIKFGLFADASRQILSCQMTQKIGYRKEAVDVGDGNSTLESGASGLRFTDVSGPLARPIICVQAKFTEKFKALEGRDLKERV